MRRAWALRPCSAMPRPSTVLRFPRSASGWCCGHTSLLKAEPHSLCFHMGVCVCVRARWGEGDKHTAAGQPGLALGPSPGALAACLPGPALGRRQEEEQELSQSLGLRAQESPGRVKTGVPWRSSMGWARGLARLPGAR